MPSATRDGVDRRRIELQIDAILIPYRIERTRRDDETMDEFRDHARSILDGLEKAAREYPDLHARLLAVRGELDPG